MYGNPSVGSAEKERRLIRLRKRRRNKNRLPRLVSVKINKSFQPKAALKTLSVGSFFDCSFCLPFEEVCF